jgi:hypothetical protein
MILQVQNGTSGINFGTINIIGGAASVAVMDPKDGTRLRVTSTGGVDGEGFDNAASGGIIMSLYICQQMLLQ